jgi:hypothetical protein
MVSGLVAEARLGTLHDALAEGADPLEAGTLALGVALAAEHQQCLDSLVEVTGRDVIRAGFRGAKIKIALKSAQWVAISPGSGVRRWW